jgi:glucose/mannose-6-phosphate isomerase
VTHPQYLDTLGLWDATAGLPEQVRDTVVGSGEVLDRVDRVALPRRADLRAVVVLGMGSSGTAADAVAAYGAAHSSLPIWVGKGYDVPSFVGPDTLVFALSYSGDTEETVAAAGSAITTGAPVVVVSGAGVLSEIAADSDLTRFDVPAGLPAARTALGALIVPVLLTLSRLGILPDVSAALERTVASLARRRDTLLAPRSAAEEVARLIGRTIPLIYGSEGLTAVAAWRWKTQVNENAKTPAFCAVQPELCHNEIAGWGQHGDVTRQVLSLVTLRHGGEHPQVARRFGLAVDATDEVMANVIPVWAEGDDDLSRFFDLALFGDFVSLHMAGRESIDPGPVPALSDVETALRP